MAFRASRTNTLFIPGVSLETLRFSDDLGDKNLAECVPQDLVSDIAHCVLHYQYERGESREAADRQNYASLNALAKRFARDDNIALKDSYTFEQFIAVVYRISCQDNHWMTARFCFHYLGKVHNVLADGLLLLNSRHLRVLLGDAHKTSLECERGITNEQVAAKINQMDVSPIEKTLTKEFIAVMGSFARTNPELFDGIRSIYVRSFLSLCVKTPGAGCEGVDIEALSSLSPSSFLDRLHAILQKQHESYHSGVGDQIYDTNYASPMPHTEAEQAHALDTDWLEWRSARALIQRFDEKFLNLVWQSLAHVDTIVFGDVESAECSLNAALTRRSMTAGEESFARLVDQYSQHVHPTLL